MNGTIGQALVVPTNASSPANLGHAVYAWSNILHDMLVSHMSIGAAVRETNSYLGTLTDVNGQKITERWQVVGDSSVKIN